MFERKREDQDHKDDKEEEKQQLSLSSAMRGPGTEDRSQVPQLGREKPTTAAPAPPLTTYSLAVSATRNNSVPAPSQFFIFEHVHVTGQQAPPTNPKNWTFDGCGEEQDQMFQIVVENMNRFRGRRSNFS